MTSEADLGYPGAQPFKRADSGRFFGRTAQAAFLGQLWLQNRLTFLSGPSGIGKSSLLRAGVLPLVEGSKVSLLPVGGLSGGASFRVAALPAHNPYTMALLRSWSPGDAPTHLADLTVDDFIGRRAELQDPSVSILAAIDQADDLLAGSASRQRYRRRFLGELADALAEQPTLHLLVSVREDALTHFTEILGQGTKCDLSPLGIGEAREAVAGPGYFAADAADDIVDSVRTSRIVSAAGQERLVMTDRVEPALLHIACARLWESLGVRAGVVRRRELRRHGDVDGELAGYCSGAIAAVAKAHDIPVAWLRFWLIRNFVTSVGDLDDAPEGDPDTVGMPTSVARALEDRYLLRGHAAPESGPRQYRLISDRLIEPLRHASDQGTAPDDPDEYLRAAERALITGDLDLAERHASNALAAAPETALRLHAQARSILGNLAYERGELDAAEEHYRKAATWFEVERDKGAVARLLFAVGRTLIARGRLTDAINELRAAVERIPEDDAVQIQLAWAVHEISRNYPL
jgi:hypothetical protein